SMNSSWTMIPPCCSVWPLRARLLPVRVCLVARATPSTMTRPSMGSTFTTRPRFPRSLPEMTCTSSFFLMLTVAIWLQHLRSQRDDLHEPLLAELPGHRPEDPRSTGVALLVDQHHGVVVEADVGAIGPAPLLRRADHDR